ncbi:MAG: tRNA 2-thiouridine(34) synthase MnmA [Actinomycetia bacterium]|nr:tRNA 2-thiouridine(34) synthase MnmA [Actinomycetes bacterium]
MEEENRIAIAMSGGIDSSMAAKMLKDRGFDLIGITMKILPDDTLPSQKHIVSWMTADIESARRVCDMLDMPHLIMDLSDSFEEKIIGPFCNAYLEGKTPNPCIECNKLIKFGLLLQKCRSLSAKYMATGHYCLVEKDNSGQTFKVRKGRDPLKEQSYFFWKLDQSQLMHIKTPLGAFTKEQIKSRSADLLSLFEGKEESQDICFINKDKYQDYLNKRIRKIKKGRILNVKGEYLGDHRGFPYYTIGQRRGLGISHGEPLYVIKIVPEKNQIIVGEKEELLRDRACLGDINFISGKPPSMEFSADVKIRYGSPGVRARIVLEKGNKAIVYFNKNVSSITPGQSAVFYDGDILLGGGIITG